MGYLIFNALLSVIAENSIINHIMLQNIFFWLHFSLRQYGSNFNHRHVIGPKCQGFSEVTQNNGHYTIQNHSRSRILVPLESLYATLYVRIIY